MYIGKEKILTVAEQSDNVQITFDSKVGIEMNKALYELTRRSKPTKQEYTDAIYNRLAKKIFIELANYGLTCLEVTTFVSHLGNLTHNLREAKIGKKFGVTTSSFIKLKDLL